MAVPGSGRTLGEAFLQDKVSLGEGRYSQVFMVTHRATGARRAVKTSKRLGPQAHTPSPHDLGMECPARLAIHEADILRRLDNPNIVRLHEVIEEKAAVHLVLELCEGGDVLERILVSNGRLPENEIAALFVQMLQAVWYLHLNGVVHRDLKPEHFLFSHREPGRGALPPELAGMKLIDFGLSHRAGGQFAPDGGTPQFMPPEAKSGRGCAAEFANRTDIWALGVVLHAMLVGHYPSPKLTDSTQAQYFNMPSWNGVSRDCLDLLGLLLKQKPVNRPAAGVALKHPWAVAALAAKGSPPEPLLLCLPQALKSWAAAPGLRRIALLAVAREVDDCEVAGVRRLFQALVRSCEGMPTGPALLRTSAALAKENPALSTAVAALARSLEATATGRSSAGCLGMSGAGTLTWSELVAVALCSVTSASPQNKNSGSKVVRDGKNIKGTSAGENGSTAPPLCEDACWRAFDFLSQSTGVVSVNSLDRLLGQPNASDKGSDFLGIGDGSMELKKDEQPTLNKALTELVKEVFPAAKVAPAEFLKLARGEVQPGQARSTRRGKSWTCRLRCPFKFFRCCRCSTASNAPGPPKDTSTANRKL